MAAAVASELNKRSLDLTHVELMALIINIKYSRALRGAPDSHRESSNESHERGKR